MTKPKPEESVLVFATRPNDQATSSNDDRLQPLRASLARSEVLFEEQSAVVQEFRSKIDELKGSIARMDRTVHRYQAVLDTIRVDRLRRRSLRLARIMGAWRTGNFEIDQPLAERHPTRIRPDWRPQSRNALGRLSS